jgi:hypothetical protein
MRKLGVEHLPLLEKLIGVLDGEPDPVNQQIAFELLVARHVMRVSPRHAEQRFVLDSMRKHILQILAGPAPG